jgi:hypothetical protein
MDSVVEFSAVASCACCLYMPIHFQRFWHHAIELGVVAVRGKIANCSLKAVKGTS